MKQLNHQIDEWFMGYKTRAIKPKSSYLGGSGNLNHARFARTGLKSGTGLTNLKAAAQKKPEVMVKIAKRISKNSNGMKGVKNHISYISRNNELPIETKDGERLQGKEINQLMKDWQKLGIPEQSQHREALNIVLSMPAGTPPQAVLQAARAFAAEQFEKHQYAMALHHESERNGEPPHPHVHLCVLMRDENGKRLNPRKNDLFEWRVRFAEKLREQGVECAATKRVHRGKTIKGERSELRAMKQRQHISQFAKQQAQELVKALANQQRPKHPYLQEALTTRGIMVEQYGLIAKELYKLGHKREAQIISRFAKEVSSQNHTTQAQNTYDKAHALLKQHQQQHEPTKPNPAQDWEMER